MTKFFLLIDGVDGGSTDADHKGWFEIQNYKFDVTGSANPQGPVAPNFSPLTVNLDVQTGLANLLATIAAGHSIDAIKLEGVSNFGDAVYDLTLTDVFLTSIGEGSIANSLVFDGYSKIGLITREQGPDGSLGADRVFGFDIAANKTINPSTLPTPVAGDVLDSTAPTKFFLLVDGFNGDSTDAAHQGWFDVTNYGFNLSANVPAPDFSALAVALASKSGLAEALKAATNGNVISSIRLEGTIADGTAVYDLTLNHAILTEVADSTFGDRLIFDGYNKIGLTTKGQIPGGVFANSDSFGFDLQTNKVIDPSSLSQPVAGAGGTSVTPTKFFLLVDGVDGGSTDEAHKGWFQVSSYDFQVDAMVPPAGGSVGAAKLSPLTVAIDLTIALPRLLADAASGHSISAVKLEGVTNNGDAVYDLTLTDIFPTLVQGLPGGQTSLTLDGYSKVGLITMSQDSSGNLSPGPLFGFDVGTQKIIDPATLPNPTAGDVPDASKATKFFLSIDGVDGGSTDAHHKGWFEVNAYDFNIDLPSLGGGGLPRPNFSPLTVVLKDIETGLTESLSRVAQGTNISAVKLEGVTADGHAVYDLTLADVVMTDVNDGLNNGLLKFDGYSKIGLATASQQPNGSYIPSDSFGYDLTSEKTIDPATLPAPVPADILDATTPNKFFLLVDGLDGGSTDEAHKGWFNVSSYNFDIKALTSGGGAGADFGPLTVGLNLATGLPGAFSDGAKGGHISAIKLEGVTQQGDAVFDLTLTDTQLSNIQIGPGGHGQFDFDGYAKIGLVTAAQQSDGTFIPSGSFGYDVNGAKIIDPSTLPTPVVGNVPDAATPTRLFLSIDGLNGNSTDAGHEGWFDITNFGLKLDQLPTSGGNAGGHPNFHPLDVALNLAPTLASVLRDIAPKTNLALVRVEGVSAHGNVVFALKLEDVHLTKVLDDTGDSDGLLFDYNKISLITHGESPAGAVGPGDAFGYNIVDGKEFTPTYNTAPSAANVSQDANENTGNPVLVTASYTDPDAGDTHTFTIDLTGTKGGVVNNNDGTFSYDPNGQFESLKAGATTTDTFHYTVTDGSGENSQAQATVTIHGENDAPSASNVTQNANENTSNPVTVTSSYTDPDSGDTHTFSVDLTGTKGSVVNNNDGTFSYDPNGQFESLKAGATTTDTFHYTVTDGSGESSQAKATITIYGENDAPSALPDIAGVKTSATVTRDAAHGVLSNDTDPDGDALSAVAVRFGAISKAIAAGGSANIAGVFGNLTLFSDGHYSYVAGKSVPSIGFAQDIFTYTTSDGSGGTAQASLTITISNNAFLVGVQGTTISAGNSKTVVDGSLGQQTINGGNGADVLIGGPGDRLTGGNGPDIFVFNPGFGKNTITDFHTGADKIQFDHHLFSSAQAVLLHITSDGHGGSLITFDANDVVTVSGVSPGSFHASDFLIS